MLRIILLLSFFLGLEGLNLDELLGDDDDEPEHTSKATVIKNLKLLILSHFIIHRVH